MAMIASSMKPKPNRAVAWPVKAGGASRSTLAIPGRRGPVWCPRLRNAFWLILVTLVLAGGQPSRAADSGSQTQPRGNEGGQPTPPRMTIIDALEAQTSSLERDFTNQVILGGRQIQAADSSTGSSGTMWLLLAITLAGVLAFHRYAPAFGDFFNRNDVPEPAAPLVRADTAADEEAFSRFVAGFSIHAHRPSRPPRYDAEGSASLRQPSSPRDDFKPKEEAKPRPGPRIPDALDAWLAAASGELAAIRASFSEIGRAPDEASRQTALGGLVGQVRCLKAKSELPEMLPVWQLASALEGLLDQIANDPAKATSSALRTTAGAVDLLHALCVRGVKPDLLSNPPVRLLAVDDDPVCRHVVAFALRKLLGQPDLATDGAAALVLAQQEFYDVIFLDVQMPGMDGFELCFRIHATALNQNTPVVFVTTHSDIGSRAKSSLTGGQDLLGKPFLTWELALKALTLIMRRRLQASLGRAEFLPRDTTASRSPARSQAAISVEPVLATPSSQPYSPVPTPA